jgi:hypothetical protein
MKAKKTDLGVEGQVCFVGCRSATLGLGWSTSNLYARTYRSDTPGGIPKVILSASGTSTNSATGTALACFLNSLFQLRTTQLRVDSQAVQILL